MLDNNGITRSARIALKDQWGEGAVLTFLFSLISGATVGVAWLVGGTLLFGYRQACLNVLRGGKVEMETLFSWFKTGTRFCTSFCATWLVALWSFVWMVPPVLFTIMLTLLTLGYRAVALFTQGMSSPEDMLMQTAIQMPGIMFWLMGSLVLKMLVCVPSICHIYLYTLTPWVLLDNPEMSSDEAINRSMKLMQRRRWRFMCLQCRFLTWILLPLMIHICSVFMIIGFALSAQLLGAPVVLASMALTISVSVVSFLGCLIGGFFLWPYYNVAVAKFYDEIRNEPEIVQEQVISGK